MTAEPFDEGFALEELEEDLAWEAPPGAADWEAYSQVNAYAARSAGVKWLTGWFCETYTEEFHEAVNRQLLEFEKFECVSAEEREEIRPRVTKAIAQIQAYQAWRFVIWEDVFGWSILLSFPAAMVCAVLAANFLGDASGVVAWIAIGIASFLAFVYLLFLTIDLLEGLPDDTPGHVSVLLVGVLLVAYGLTLTHLSWLGGVIRDTALITLLAFAGYLAMNLLAAGFLKFISMCNERRKVREHPEDEIIQTLCFVLARLHTERARWTELDLRNAIAYHLGWMGNRVEQELFVTLQAQDLGTHAWLRKETRGIAADFYRLEREVLLPRAPDPDELTEVLATKFVVAAEGRWGQLERSVVEVEPLPKVSLWRRLLSVLAVAAPLALLAAALIPGVPLGEARAYVVLPAFLWAMAKLGSLVDNQWDKTIAHAAKVSEIVKLPGAKGR